MATVYCFTSTGNSLHVVKKIAGSSGGTVLPMSRNPVPCEDNIIGFVFPVFFWGLPRMVSHFITTLKMQNKDAYLFAVATCGGPITGIPGITKKLFEEKGVTLHYATRLVMVS